jgi:hypothetical protein
MAYCHYKPEKNMNIHTYKYFEVCKYICIKVIFIHVSITMYRYL